MKKDPASRRAALPEGSMRETDRALAGGHGGSETLGGVTGTSPVYTSEHPWLVHTLQMARASSCPNSG